MTGSSPVAVVLCLFGSC